VPASKRQLAEGGVRAHCIVLVIFSLDMWLSSRLLPYLNLQEVVAANTLVVHLMVSIVSITTALVLNKGKAGRVVSTEG
jgi:hypothetical protein